MTAGLMQTILAHLVPKHSSDQQQINQSRDCYRSLQDAQNILFLSDVAADACHTLSDTHMHGLCTAAVLRPHEISHYPPSRNVVAGYEETAMLHTAPALRARHSICKSI